MVRRSVLSRRSLVRSAAMGAAAACLPRVTTTFAQTPEATPVETVNATPRPSRGGSLKLVRPGSSVANFNPAAFAQDQQIPRSYLEPLIRPDPQTLEPRPWLAERWAWRQDGLELVLTIREGTIWHDGQPFDAADARFSYTVYRDDVDSLVAGLFGLVESIEVASDRELVVSFTERDANWLFNAATLPIFSRRQYDTFWESGADATRTLSRFDWSNSTPVGTGPWQIEAWDEQQVEFRRFDRYWGDPPRLDSLHVAVEEGGRRRIEAWMSGDSALAWPVTERAARAIDEAEGRLVAAPAASVMFAAFNFANPNQPNGSLWGDVRVRQAAALAIDRKRYADEVFGGHIRHDAAGTIAQPWAYDDAVVSPALNLERAEILLAEAGWADYDGDGILEDATGVPLRPVVIVSEESRPELLAVLARVGRDLATVGIGLEIEVLPIAAFDDRWIVQRNFDLIAYAYDLLPGFADFDLYGSAWDIRTNPAGWNPGGYSNAAVDEAIADFLGAVSIERQRDALQRLQQAVNDDLFGLWFGFPDDLILVADGIAGFEPDMAWQTARTWTLWLADDKP